jgi:hypothetical protein
VQLVCLAKIRIAFGNEYHGESPVTLLRGEIHKVPKFLGEGQVRSRIKSQFFQPSFDQEADLHKHFRLINCTCLITKNNLRFYLTRLVN